MGTIQEAAEHMRRMGETEESITYMTSRRESSLLEVFGKALDPRGLTMESVVAVMRPATNTGD